MLRLIQITKRLILAFIFLVVSVVLFPGQAEGLWDWGKSIGDAFGQDPLPAFATMHGFAGFSLLIATVVGIAYTVWRDRRFEILQAEYTHKTGANHLKQKVRELESQLESVRLEKEEVEHSLKTLNKQHTEVLVMAKEHEVHRKYGQEDRAALKELRTQFETLLREKGNTIGLRDAWQLMMQTFPDTSDLGDLTVTTTNPKAKNGKNGSPPNVPKQNALPFGR